MVGQVGVYPLVLEGPATRIRRGQTIAFGVRAPDGAGEVTIEADYGSGFVPVAAADAGRPGARPPGSRRARRAARGRRGDRDRHLPRRLLRRDEQRAARGGHRRARPVRAGCAARARGSVVTVSANPATPGARVVLQVNLRERFGWWPVKRARLDKRGHAALRGERLRARCRRERCWWAPTGPRPLNPRRAIVPAARLAGRDGLDRRDPLELLVALVDLVAREAAPLARSRTPRPRTTPASSRRPSRGAAWRRRSRRPGSRGSPSGRPRTSRPRRWGRGPSRAGRPAARRSRPR